jgi:ferredoxin-type protein NapF
MSAPDPARRALLRGRVPGPLPMRPPWARTERFTELCTRCLHCATACPEHIILRGDGGFPELDFTRGACTFCGACAAACPEPIFEARSTVPWRAQAAIDKTCLATRGIVCRTCRDECPEDAVRFELALGGVARPHVLDDRCNGCGACVAACPADAIRIVPEGARDAA